MVQMGPGSMVCSPARFVDDGARSLVYTLILALGFRVWGLGFRVHIKTDLSPGAPTWTPKVCRIKAFLAILRGLGLLSYLLLGYSLAESPHE